MQYVYIVIAPTGFIWGVFADYARAEKQRDHVWLTDAVQCRISREPIIKSAA